MIINGMGNATISDHVTYWSRRRPVEAVIVFPYSWGGAAPIVVGYGSHNRWSEHKQVFVGAMLT